MNKRESERLNCSIKLAYSINEAMEATTLSRGMLDRLIDSGKLAAVKVGTRKIIKADSLRELVGAGTK